VCVKYSLKLCPRTRILGKPVTKDRHKRYYAYKRGIAMSLVKLDMTTQPVAASHIPRFDSSELYGG
jgi:hypothetical protein